MGDVRLLAIPAAIGLAAGLLVAAAGPQETAGAGGPARISAAQLEAGGSPVLGDPGAPVTIVEWGDYQCTFCFKFHQSTLESLEGYVESGEVRMVFKDFVLNGPDSGLAAEASHCAAEQGLYWEYHDALYENWGGERTGWITPGSLEVLAEGAGLEAGPFAECLESGRHAEKVAGLYEEGRSLGVDGTPSFLIYGDEKAVRITGNQPLGAFEAALADLGVGAGG
ncbi:MAG: DsbA family protein [Nitrosopumilus sp.]|nr:DsbA family protein [Nitrosopumilus sp.]CAI9831319.1 DSBA oxidoreductase [Nitrosopumilaceae archaeon]MDA7940941.1 DsbA family protein [Nitrosopumilus sp.]MDA7943203.1 DsbA family protein [Nitrosopumilus sp.]MDA7944304.1 DsbA family protein [Nitrosopumilus sp.]